MQVIWFESNQFHFIYVQAQKKMEKAERVLGKVETALRPTEDSRPKTITEEERFMFRKHMSCYIFSLLLSQIARLFNPSFFYS